MFTFLATIHIIVSIIMVAFILLQDPKGGGGALGMLGGGSSKGLFGSTGGNQFLVSVTKWTAIIFAFTSIYLAALSSQKDESVMDEYTQEAGEAGGSESEGSGEASGGSGEASGGSAEASGGSEKSGVSAEASEGSEAKKARESEGSEAEEAVQDKTKNR